MEQVRMKKNYTDITFVLDRSGSMETIWKDVEGGLSGFIAENKKLPGEVRFTLVVFDTGGVDTVLNHVDIKAIEKIDLNAYRPRGGTPLYDAVGRTVNSLGSYLSGLAESARPERVLFAIMTDGQENSSKEFRSETVKNMVKHQSDRYNWDFVYLGANQDAVFSGRELGIAAGNSIQYVASKLGTANVFDGTLECTASYRLGNAPKGNFFNKRNVEENSVESINSNKTSSIA
jgi:Mg-chelatase subunit ChlD